MPSFDWMFDPFFRQRVLNQVAAAARDAGMRSYDTDIADALWQRLV